MLRMILGVRTVRTDVLLALSAPPSPFRLLSYAFALRLATSCGQFFLVLACVCVVDISSCPRGWTDVTSSSFYKSGVKKTSPMFRDPNPQCFKL